MDPSPRRVIIVGHDQLALQVCEELRGVPDCETVLLWSHSEDLAEQARFHGAGFVGRRPDNLDALRAAKVEHAATIMTLSSDDRLNLQVALRARDLNPSIRIVLRQFNRTLGRKVEQNLMNCSVLSVSAFSAPTFASAAVSSETYQALNFPYIDGKLFGFKHLPPDAAHTDTTIREAENDLDGRILAVDGELVNDRSAPFAPQRGFTIFTRVRSTLRPAAPKREAPPAAARRLAPRKILARTLRAIKRADPVLKWYVACTAFVFVAASIFFAKVLHVDPLTAAYFVSTTITTTGYGDITPKGGGILAETAAIVLMFIGLAITGTFIALLTSQLTKMQWIAVQGLRRIRRQGHVVVCGAGNVGSRVIESLLALDHELVVVERNPRPETIEASRDRHFDLLTGDATLDSTLDLFNLEQAVTLVALTENDTMNLEVALGARARNPNIRIVMRVVEEAFAASVRTHFGFATTYAPAMLAAPAFAGLAFSPGARGRVRIGVVAYDIREEIAAARPLPPGAIPLCVLGDDGLRFVSPLDALPAGAPLLFLVPAGLQERDRVAQDADAIDLDFDNVPVR
jgi:Trk K+ transport system NAD-binding subunit